MKYILPIIFLFVPILAVQAIPNPAPMYCTELGYQVSGGYCVFNDGQKCELWAFYNKQCGAEYIKQLACVKEGESLKPGYVCCNNLVGISNDIFGDNLCIKSVGSFPKCAPCGNGVCNIGENKCNCPQDCGSISYTICGNGVCDSNENNSNCPSDCTRICPMPSAPYCPNGKLINRENDKYGCLMPPSCCGNNLCEENESAINCNVDCVVSIQPTYPSYHWLPTVNYNYPIRYYNFRYNNYPILNYFLRY